MLLNSKNIHILKKEGKEILLVGTAHVSKDSAQEVKELIEQEKPDSVCVELCHARYNSINNRNKWKNMDIITIIKQKKALLLLVNLILSSFQKRLAQQLGINPGQEMSFFKIRIQSCFWEKELVRQFLTIIMLAVFWIRRMKLGPSGYFRRLANAL